MKPRDGHQSLNHKFEHPPSGLRSLRYKLVFSHLAVIVVSMTIMGFLLLSLVRGYFILALEQSLTTQGYLIVQALIPKAISPSASGTPLPSAFNTVQQQQVGNLSVQVESKDNPLVEETNPQLEESNLAYLNESSVELSTALETHIRVLDERGVVLVDSAGVDEGVDLSDEPAVAASLAGEERSQIQRVSGEEWLFVTVPMMVEGYVEGAVYLGQPLRDVAVVLTDLGTRLLISLAVAIPLSVIVSLALARTIAHPVQSLTLAAGKLSSGDFDHPLQTTRRDELGHLSRTFAAMRDRLRSVEHMRTQFVSDVSHELRTPLTAIKGLTETLRDGAAKDQSVREKFLASIEEETDRLIRLVNDLLILTRADAEALNLHLQPVNLYDLVISTLDRFKPQSKTLGVELDLAFDSRSLNAVADRDRIEQILVILLDNALKHTPPEGHIILKGFRVKNGEVIPKSDSLKSTQPTSVHAMNMEVLGKGSWAVFCVTDTGEGITAQDLPHIFERFYRADPSRSRDRGGKRFGPFDRQSARRSPRRSHLVGKSFTIPIY